MYDREIGFCLIPFFFFYCLCAINNLSTSAVTAFPLVYFSKYSAVCVFTQLYLTGGQYPLFIKV